MSLPMTSRRSVWYCIIIFVVTDAVLMTAKLGSLSLPTSVPIGIVEILESGLGRMHSYFVRSFYFNFYVRTTSFY